MHYLPRENDFYLLKNKIHFHINGFALETEAPGNWEMAYEGRGGLLEFEGWGSRAVAVS